MWPISPPPDDDNRLGGWQVEGSLFAWDYTIFDPHGIRIADISKQLFHLTDTYVIDVGNPNDALYGGWDGVQRNYTFGNSLCGF